MKFPDWMFRYVYVVKQIGRDYPHVYKSRRVAVYAANQLRDTRGGDWVVVRHANSSARATAPKVVYRTDRCTY